MKKYFAAFLVLASLSLPMAMAGVKEEVEAAEQAWVDGITKNDMNILKKALADDLYYLHSNGKVDNKASYIESMSSGRQRYISVNYNEKKVRVYGTAAVLTADVVVDTTTDGKPSGGHLKFTHVFAKGKSGWQMVSHQSLKLAQ